MDKSKLKCISILMLLRPKQWVKNCVIFAALFFSGNLFDHMLFFRCIYAFVFFCIISSCVYIVNDISDIDKDRAHPIKRNRPLASGAVKIRHSVVLFSILLPTSLIGSFCLEMSFGFIVLAYFLINIAYSLKLKHIPIIDVMCVSAGFVLRVIAGGLVIYSELSSWILICTMLLSLFLAIQKRRGEIDTVASDGSDKSRSVLKLYSKELLRDMASVVDSTTIMAYCLYTFNSTSGNAMMLTIPFVIYGLFRYQYIVNRLQLAETPDAALFKDKPLFIDVLLWCITCAIILYVF